MVLLTVLSQSAHAEPQDNPEPIPLPSQPRAYDHYWREIWAGADVSKDAWLVYSGATIAPWSHIHKDGFRLRTAFGYGQYNYNKHLGTGATTVYSENFKADTAFADVLAGYLVQWGPMTAKVFAGVSFISHNIAPFDDENFSTGDEFGFKAAIELWFDTGPSTWTSLDLSYSTSHNTGTVRTRSGYRLTPSWSIGAEAGLNLDGQGQCKTRLATADCKLNEHDVPKELFDYGRTGLFARYEWDGGEVSVSAGAVGQFYRSGEFEVDPYVTMNWIMQF